MATRVIKPPARLEPRNQRERKVSDAQDATGNDITYEQLKSVSIFKEVKYERIDLRALPGTIVVRYFAAGEDICVENDPGYTAFYVLTRAECAALKLAAPGSAATPERVLAIMRESKRRSKKQSASDTVYMGEGELFGELSCLYRVPRSATVRAVCDCYVLEFLRNVLDKINTGPFRNQLDEIYKKRFLELQLRNMELFRNLSEDAYAKLRDGIELKTLLPGELIFDEHDKPDGLYIIRSGFVKIIKNMSALLGQESIPDWTSFHVALIEGSKTAGPKQKLLELLGGTAFLSHPDAQAAQESRPTSLTLTERRDLLYSLNDLIKRKDCAVAIGFEFTGPFAGWADEAKQLAALKKDDSSRIRRFSRHLIEAVFPNLIVAYGVEPPRVLAYRSAPEWVASATAADADAALIGEIGLLNDGPRTATCLAYGQSDDRYGGVRLVYISKQLYHDLLEASNQAAPGPNGTSTSVQRVQSVARKRQSETTARLNLPVWQQDSIAQQFDDLGLIQGQKLMLIDLDRCTRCDKCVEACVTSHTPGWFDWLPMLGNTGPRDGRSRLFLEGPRMQAYENSQIKNYLIPATCRQCKDPVCLIGCPVGSIHKGDNGQIVIEDWCIGCSRCALNCPYDAIQMHTIGVLPRSVTGWRHRQGRGPAQVGATPFRFNRDFEAIYGADQPIEFAYDFELTTSASKSSKMFMLHIDSETSALSAQLNGKPINLRRLDVKEAKQKGWNYEAMLTRIGEPAPPMLPGETAPEPLLRLDQNQIVVELSPANLSYGALLLEAGITGYVPPVVDRSVAGDDYKQDWVMQTAVVCDMCSGQFGKQPACVTACPHEAAQRREVTLDTFLR